MLKPIDSNKSQPRKRPYYKLISNDVNNMEDEEMANDEMDKLAKDFEEISNYKLIVE